MRIMDSGHMPSVPVRCVHQIEIIHPVVLTMERWECSPNQKGTVHRTVPTFVITALQNLNQGDDNHYRAIHVRNGYGQEIAVV